MCKVLVVVDMQNDFINGALGTNEAVQIVPNVVKKIRNFEGKIIATRDTHYENYMCTQEGKNLPVEHCIKNTKGWEINDLVQAELDKKSCFEIIDKLTFGSKDLAFALEKESVEEIELVGLCTDICVISNALVLKAFLPEVKITVDASCCAGVTPDSHKNSLEAMKMCQINIINESFS